MRLPATFAGDSSPLHTGLLARATEPRPFLATCGGSGPGRAHVNQHGPHDGTWAGLGMHAGGTAAAVWAMGAVQIEKRTGGRITAASRVA